ncbi:hypothetical protein [Hugenholtzia roseola]|uniref:hypothetical protein n=1 Tax=Hugenholtzia roseola TaxID=1002 RepID=UPI0004069B68|nr:hypothetical protein [Hugenholtzia roseola]
MNDAYSKEDFPNPDDNHLENPQTQDTQSDQEPESDTACQLCEREGKKLTFHHLIPRKMHKKKQFLKLFSKKEMQSHGLMLCRLCHNTLHDFFDEKTLGLHYHTKELLLAEAKIQNYLEWAKKQR